jgi:hypothetical protein
LLPTDVGHSDEMFGRMMRLGTLVLLVRSAWALNCSIEPLYVDIHYRDVSGSSEQQYGTYVGIGSPPQNQTLWPSLTQNETSFASPYFCANSNLTDCINSNGGVFNPSASTSYVFLAPRKHININMNKMDTREQFPIDHCLEEWIRRGQGHTIFIYTLLLNEPRHIDSGQ